MIDPFYSFPSHPPHQLSLISTKTKIELLLVLAVLMLFLVSGFRYLGEIEESKKGVVPYKFITYVPIFPKETSDGPTLLLNVFKRTPRTQDLCP